MKKMIDAMISKDTIFKSRSLAGRISASFKFVTGHLKYLLKISAWILLPLAVIEAVIITFYSNNMQNLSAPFISSLGSGLVLAGVILFAALIYTLLRQYAEKGYLPHEGLKKLLRPLRINFIKLLWAGLLYMFVWVILSLIAAAGIWYISWVTLFITIPLFLFVFVPLAYLPYIYIFEPIGFGEAIKKSFRIGVPSWGSTFAIILLMAILTGIIQVAASLPAGTAMVIRNFAQKALVNGGQAALPGFFQFLLFIFTVFSVFVSVFAQVFSMAALAFQYGNVVTAEREKREAEPEIQKL